MYAKNRSTNSYIFLSVDKQINRINTNIATFLSDFVALRTTYAQVTHKKIELFIHLISDRINHVD